MIKKVFTLGKEERLKSRKAIEILFKEGKSFSVFPLRILYRYQIIASSALQTGFAVSTKNFKHAVERNRIKRLMKEAYRLQKKKLLEKLKSQNKFLSIFFIYTGKELPEYKEIFGKINIVIEKLEKIADENADANS